MKKRVIAVGFFDGLHKGHSALMKETVRLAKEKNCTSAVFTFEKHPETVVFNKKIPLLTCPTFRENDIKKYGGVSEVFFWNFDEENSKIPWDTFILDVLIKKYNACHIITGEDFKFGHKGLGNAKNVAEFCEKNGIGFTAIKKVLEDDTRISSTQIREFIKNGEIETANNLLGHTFKISGTVNHGRKVGRKLGFRTVNINLPEDMIVPKFGVYATKVIYNNKEYIATTNVGIVPSFVDDLTVKIEAHILDFDKEIYDELVTIKFYKFLREERKFADINELKTTIELNIMQTKEFFKGEK